MKTWLNGNLFGDVESGPSALSFRDIVEHICKTRSFCAGTIVGSGTVSNEDTSRDLHVSAKKILETIANRTPTTSYMTDGDHVQMRCLIVMVKASLGRSIKLYDKYDQTYTI